MVESPGQPSNNADKQIVLILVGLVGSGKVSDIVTSSFVAS